MVNVIRKSVPDELLVRLLSQIGFRSLEDPIEIRRPQLKTADLTDLLAELSPYYIPYAAKKYLIADMTIPRYMTILRHCLRQRGRDVLARETSERGKKITCYRLDPAPGKGPIPASFDVSFD